LTTTASEHTDAGSSFRTFLAGAVRLVAGRQGSAVIFAAAVLALPLLASSGTVTSFTWAYVGMLTLTSLLGFGLERLATTRVAERGEAPAAVAVRPLVLVRIVTLPVVALALVLLFAFVDVELPLGAFAGTVGWILSVHVAVVAAAGLRAVGNVRAEPLVTVVVRSAQAGLLIGLAWSGAGVTTLVGMIAVAEAVGALALCRALGPGWWSARRDPRRPSQDLRRAVAFAAMEAAALLYLRADLLLVGHLLGATAGATYGLLYRVVDGGGGAVGTTGLWLFSTAVTGRDGGDADDGVRARAIRTLPLVVLGVSIVGIAGAGLLGDLVPRFAGETDTLRLLVVAFPLLTFNGLELYVRSARGRNRSVLTIGLLALAVNVGLCLWLVPRDGLLGAAVALLGAEVVQTVAVIATSRQAERRVVVPAAAIALLGTLALAGFVLALESLIVTAIVVFAAGCLLAVVGLTRAPPKPVEWV